MTTPARITAVAVLHELSPADWKPWGVTAIDKRAVAGSVQVGPLGLEGDDQCDRENHGGPFQAVYVYADEDAARWATDLGREIPPGLFGENLRTAGVDVTGAEVGERWRLGQSGPLLEVTSPREPCRTFAERMGLRGWVKRFADAGMPGAYLRVLEAGPVSAGDPVAVEHRPGHGITIGAVAGRSEPAVMRRLLALGDQGLELSPALVSSALRIAQQA